MGMFGEQMRNSGASLLIEAANGARSERVAIPIQPDLSKCEP
jgi:hypothetical protein